jgi:CCR4-NOT transcription complex subunit 1
VDAYIHFLRRLFAHAQPKLTNSTTPAGVSESTAALTFRLLLQETQRLSRDPFLADRFRDGVDKGEGEFFRTFDLIRFADRVRLAPLEKLVLASSFVAGATRKDLSAQAANMIKAEFEGAVLSLCHNPSFDQSDLSPNQLSKLMANLLSDLPTDSPILDAAQRQALITAAQTKYGKETISPILHRILPTLSLPAGTSLVQVLVQLGPEITSEPDTVRALLARFGLTDAAPPREAQVIEIISTLARLGAEATADVSSLVRALSSFVRFSYFPAYN